MKSIELDQFYNYFKLVKSWTYQKHPTPVWQINSMTHLAIENKLNGTGIKTKNHYQFLKKILKNELIYNEDNKTLECHLRQPSDSYTKIKMDGEREAELTVYTGKTMQIIVQQQIVRLQPGFSKIIIQCSQNTKIEIYSTIPNSIYIIDVHRAEYS